MGKKKQKYRLPEHELNHNRVDIFRSIQGTALSHLNSTDPSCQPMGVKSHRNNFYTNETFISSNANLARANQPDWDKVRNQLGGCELI